MPLTREHGFPLRIYIPDVLRDETAQVDHWPRGDRPLGAGYWVKRGWDKVAQMKSTSVIDVVAMDMTIIQSGQESVYLSAGLPTPELAASQK